VLSQVGSQVGLLVLPLVALTTLHASALAVGLLAACGTLPLLVIGLLAGAWVDRLRCRDVMIVCDVLRAILIAIVPLAWRADCLGMWQLYAVSLCVGSATVFFDVADNTLCPMLVGRSRLVDANAVLQTITSIANIAGPGLAGVVVSTASAPSALFVSMTGYLSSAALIIAVRFRQVKPPRLGRRPRLVTDIKSGVRFLLGHRLVRVVVACSASLNFFGSISSVALITFMARQLGLSASAMGLLLTCSGIGGLVGGYLVAGVTRALGQGRTACWAAALTGLPVLLIPLVQDDGRLAMLGVALFAMALGGVMYNVTVLSFRQASTPPEILGRVNASARVVILGVMPLGSLLGGALCQILTPRSTLWIAGVGAALSFLWIYLSPFKAVGRRRGKHVAPNAPPREIASALLGRWFRGRPRKEPISQNLGTSHQTILPGGPTIDRGRSRSVDGGHPETVSTPREDVYTM
jgi:MFS family permease